MKYKTSSIIWYHFSEKDVGVIFCKRWRLHCFNKSLSYDIGEKIFCFKCRIFSTTTENFIKAYCEGTGCIKNSCSGTLVFWKRFHERRTITEKNSLVVTGEASKIGRYLAWQLWTVYSSLSSFTFCESLDWTVPTIIWLHLFSKNLEFHVLWKRWRLYFFEEDMLSYDTRILLFLPNKINAVGYHVILLEYYWQCTGTNKPWYREINVEW